MSKKRAKKVWKLNFSFSKLHLRNKAINIAKELNIQPLLNIEKKNKYSWIDEIINNLIIIFFVSFRFKKTHIIEEKPNKKNHLKKASIKKGFFDLKK